MDENDSSTAISIKPNTIKAAQGEMGRLDVLVCGQCHSVFHFIDEFQEHRSKEGACSKISNFRENSNNEQKAQVWAFLLWKDTQIQQDSPDKDKDTNSWKLYKKWCQMDTHVRDCWITAGKTIQTFTKISNAKMQDVPRQQGNITTEGGKTLVVRKVIRNGQPDSPDKKEIKSDSKVKTEPESKRNLKLKPSIKIKDKMNESNENNIESSDEEYAVEKILAKRFNPKKKVYEYLLKWEGYAHEHNTWEEVSQVSNTCKILMDDFEKNLAKQKEIKAQQVAKSINKTSQLGIGAKVIKLESAQAGPSSDSGRPMRSSKSKALHQVKQWCGTMKDEDTGPVLGKRKIAFSDSDSEDEVGMKRSKVDTSGEDDWALDSEEDKAGRSDVIQRAFIRATGQSNGSNRGPLTGTDLTNSMLANAKGVKMDQKQSSSQSNVYIVHRKDGIIKLDSSPTNKISVKGQNQQGVLMVHNRDNSGNIVKNKVLSSANSITPVKVMTKPDGTQVVTQMKVVPKALSKGKNEPIKIQPKPDPNQVQQIQIVTAIPSPLVQSQRVTTAVRPAVQRTADGRPLLPRPSGIRGTTPTTAGLMAITQTRSPVRAPPPRHLTPQGTQQRQVVQNRNTSSTSTMQGSSPSTTTIRPKITVMNQQGKVVQKTVVSPINVTRPPPKAGTLINKNQSSIIATQQKVFAARDKLAKEAGVKSTARGGAVAKGAGRNRAATKVETTVSACNKPKESKLANTIGLHMEFHEVQSEESSSDDEPDFPPLPVETTQPAAPESPPRDFTLCPLTGRIIGPDGQPVDPPESEPNSEITPTPMAIIQASSSGTATITTDGIITTHTGENAELVLPNLESLSDGSGGIVRVEMSPGGTTGTIVQTSDSSSMTLSNVVVPGPDLPCLDDPTIEVQTTSTGGVLVNVPPISIPEATATTSSEVPEAPAATITVTTTSSAPLVEVTTAVTTSTATDVAATTTTVTPDTMIAPVTKQEAATENVSAAAIKMEDNGAGVVTITSEDGVVYQVTGQGEDGQTLLVTRGADGEEQCVYVTTDQQNEDGSVLTIDHAVAEAVAQLMPDQMQQQFYVKEGTDGTTEETVESTPADNQEINMSIMDNSNAVVTADQQPQADNENLVAQVIQADEPTPGGTRRVVLLLPDGNLMMTEVDEEQYAALELDK